jgi:hypothetical protein
MIESAFSNWRYFLNQTNKGSRLTNDEELKNDLTEVYNNLIPQTQKMANKNWYRYFLKQWVVFASVIIVISLGLIAFFVSLGFPLFRTVELDALNSLGLSSIVGPSITVIGFVMAFSPVISLFYFNELREYRNNIYEIIDGILSPLRDCDREQKKELSKKLFEHFFTLFSNKMSSILKYLATFIVVCLVFFPMIIVFFIVFSNGAFLILDMCVMLSLIVGVIPILLDAVGRTSLKIKNPYTVV